MCEVEYEDVVGAAPTGDAPASSKWSTISLPIKMRLILGGGVTVGINQFTHIDRDYFTTSPAPGQAYDCPGDSEAIMTSISKSTT